MHVNTDLELLACFVPVQIKTCLCSQCEDIHGPQNGSTNGLRGNLSSEHERISGALRKSEVSMQLLWQVTICTQQLGVPGDRTVRGR